MAANPRPHEHAGALIVVEGIDGSGKTTQQQLLRKWLASRGMPVFYTEWNSSPLVKKATKAGKKKAALTPTTFSLLHATDFADRHLYQIVPPLKAGMVIVADRYVYTAFARDQARGVHPEWIRGVYSFATKPDLAFYFRVPVDVAVKRLLSARLKLKYYEAGMDLGLSADTVESFRLFQQRVVAEYEKLADEYGLVVVDATKAIPEQQRAVRQAVAARFGLAADDDEL
jgi:dTMP kinase